jgi:2'-5' RNA ligase
MRRPNGERVSLRLFLALPVPASVREALVAVQADLRQTGGKVSWVRPENLHVTLVFLGDVVTGRVDAVRRVVEEAVPMYPGFDLYARGVGAFGSARSPRVVWAGFDSVPAALVEMHGLLAEGLRGIGFDVERRAFKAHVTLGRVRSARGVDALTSAMASVKNAAFGPVPVRRVQLMRSDLGPQGARYTVLHEVMLKGAADHGR